MESPEIYYIGRRHVEAVRGDPVVGDWRAPVAIPFYRATFADPLGLARRRRFTFAGRELADIFEEDFDDPDSLAGSGGVPDPLLAELGRARTGQMRDIVATIQGEQDVVIQAALDECLVVQGGPGTGKTAVGLHRAAYLLYEQRESARAHRGARARTEPGVPRLHLPGPPIARRDVGHPVDARPVARPALPLHARRLPRACAPARRRALVHRHPARRRRGDRAADRAARVALPVAGRAHIDPERAAELIDGARDSLASASAASMPVRQQRERFRARLLRFADDDWSGGELQATSLDEFTTEVLADKESRAAVDRCWKTVNPIATVRALLTSKATLARTAAGVFDNAEQRAIARRRAREGTEELWSAQELPLLDEAEGLIGGDVRRFGHVVVDEAQDYSPMALRMVARRALRGSMTILGDLAQATGPHPTTDWDVALIHLGRPAHARRAELTGRLPPARRVPRGREPAAPRGRTRRHAGPQRPRGRRPAGDRGMRTRRARGPSRRAAHELTTDLATVVAVIAPRARLARSTMRVSAQATTLGDRRGAARRL